MDNEVPKHSHGSPVVNALFNFLILGSPYLSLHLYKRFFVVYGLVATLVIAAIAGVLLEPYLTIVILAIPVATAIDVYVQTKKMNTGEIPFPTKNPFFLGLGIFAIIAFIAFSVFGKLAEPGPDGESTFEEFLSDQAQQQRENQIASKFSMTRDPRCDAFKNDSRLVVGSYHGNFSFTEYCYFQKAVETKDPNYCLGYHESLGFNDDCLGYVAHLNDDPGICAEMATHEISCEAAYRYKKPLGYPCDSSRMPESIQTICQEEFENFYLSLPPSPYDY